MSPDVTVQIMLIAQLVGSIGMFGAIWVIQAAHYPLQRHVDHEQFVTFQASHMQRISYVVGPLMLIEAASATWLLFLDLPAPGMLLAWVGMGLVLLLWLSTLLLQVPCHWILERGWDERAHHRLVMTNWVRTLAWTGRAVIAIWMLML